MSAPIILTVVGALCAVVAGAYLLRQMAFARGRGSFACALWRRSVSGREGWQAGLIRYRSDRLLWYRAFSLRLRPEVVLHRRDILDITREAIPAHEGEEQMLLRLHLREGRERHLLASRSAASGLLSWTEAAPVAWDLHGID